MTNSAAALARYTASMRRQRTVYFAVVAVLVLAIGAFAGVVWSRGEAAHTTLHTAAKPPTALAIAGPSRPQRQAWHSADRIALGTPITGGTVITYSRNAVRGRDARTGKVTWSYTRTDRRVCAAAQVAGTTIAVFAVHGNCDEVNAFESGTGKRRWSRTLDKDGMPLDGSPAYQWTAFTFMVTSASVIYAIDPATGLDRWTYTRFGCRIQRAVLGSAGALISQNCVRPDCGNLQRCGPGQQLLLRDGTAGNGDDSKRDRDQVKWIDLGNGDVPVSADRVLSAINRTTRQLEQYRADNGKPLATVALSPLPSSLAGIVAIDTADAQVVWIGGVTYALNTGRSEPHWATPTAAPPTIVSTTDNATPVLSTARVSVPTSTGIAVLDGNDGHPALRLAVAAPSARSLVYPLGTGYLVRTDSGTVAFR